jgi:hypothetical protein
MLHSPVSVLDVNELLLLPGDKSGTPFWYEEDFVGRGGMGGSSAGISHVPLNIT